MSKEVLTHSEAYVRKTNRIILTIGLTSLIIFLIGVFLLMQSGDTGPEYEEPVFTDSADAINIGERGPLLDTLEFGEVEEGEIPLTTTPNPVPMGQVVLGTTAKNVLTLGTNAKASIKIVSVTLAEPPADGFSFVDKCSGKSLRGEETCQVTMSWEPVVAGNVQNNFIITWHELNLTQENAKAAKVPVIGNAISKEDCNFCENVPGEVTKSETKASATRYAIGPDGKVIGTIDDDGYVRDANGNIIGRVNANGLIVDENGNVIGVAEARRLVYDANGNVIGYVNADGTVVDKDGNVIGRVLPDGTVVDMDGNVIGTAVDSGFVYDENGNIIGRVMPDGTVVDMNGNIIGRVNEKGEVVDMNGNIIGRVAKQGRVAVDENGNTLGVVMPNGTVVDQQGRVVGRVDENGNIIVDEVIGQADGADQARRLAYDKDGNVIGYIDENGNVIDFNGNIIGKMQEDGTLVDKDGNIIGKAGDYVRLTRDADGKIIGYVDKDGNVLDFKGNAIGRLNANGQVTSLKGRIIGSLVQTQLIPITPAGQVLGKVGNNGTVESNGQIVGRVLASGLVKDVAGNKVVAQMVKGGLVVGYGCKHLGYLDADGKIKNNGKETEYKIL